MKIRKKIFRLMKHYELPSIPGLERGKGTGGTGRLIISDIWTPDTLAMGRITAVSTPRGRRHHNR